MGRDTMLDNSWLPREVDQITEYYYCNKQSPGSLGNEGGSIEHQHFPTKIWQGWMGGESGYRQIRQDSMGVLRWLTIL